MKSKYEYELYSIIYKNFICIYLRNYLLIFKLIKFKFKFKFKNKIIKINYIK